MIDFSCLMNIHFHPFTQRIPKFLAEIYDLDWVPVHHLQDTLPASTISHARARDVSRSHARIPLEGV